jgi:transposase
MSKKRFELLSEAQWELIEPLLPEPKRRKDKRGRPWASNRACMEGILWVLQTGAAWRFLPDKYPSPATCWRRLKQWEEQDVWLDAWRTLLGALDGEGRHGRRVLLQIPRDEDLVQHVGCAQQHNVVERQQIALVALLCERLRTGVSP